MTSFKQDAALSQRVPVRRTRRHARHLVGALLLVLSLPAAAQTVIFKEDFTQPSSTPIIHVNQYSRSFNGATITYTADPQWLSNCNGWITQFLQPANSAAQIADCNSATGWNTLQQMAQALGEVDGLTQEQAKNNFAVSAFTSANPGAGRIELESSQIPLPTPGTGTGRFITFQVDVAATSCQANAPLLQFYLLTPTNQEIAAGDQINPCASGQSYPVDAIGGQPAATISAGRYTAPGAVLYTTGNTLAVRLRNNQGSGTGNDHAFDSIQIVDVTPTLSKRFATPLLLAGQSNRLTFTVTNTSDQLEKKGWTFTDTLPANLTVASPNNLASTCTGSTVNANAGSSSIQVTSGDLPLSAASCTISVDVVASAAGTYTNNQTNISNVVALNLNTNASMQVVTNRLVLHKLSYSGVGSFAISGNNGIANHALTTTAMGTPVAGPQQILGGSSDSVDTTFNETLSNGWQLFGVTCTGLAAGVSPTFTPTGTITLPAAGMPIQAGGRDIDCTLENRLATDLAIQKTDQDANGNSGTVVRGQPTTFTLQVSNNGPGTSVGASVRDTPDTGLTCPATNPVTCSGPAGACPAKSLTVGDLLSSSGTTLGTLLPNTQVSLRYQCTAH